jgi:DNA-binding LacI/PurR family transcriptional regulator
MGYTPVHAAKRDKNTSYTIGVITVESYFAKFASFYWKMYQEVATRATKKNCFTMLEVISHDAENSLEPPKLLQETRVDGVIVIGRPKNAYLKMLYQYQKVPMVFLDFYDDENICDSVVSASFYGSYQMTKYLVEMGHKKIGYVGTLMYTESITDRYFGYCKALMENKIPVKEEWIVPDRSMEEGIIGLDYKFQLPQTLPTAFVCNNDVTAYALIKTLENKGVRVPEDVSIVPKGFAAAFHVPRRFLSARSWGISS